MHCLEKILCIVNDHSTVLTQTVGRRLNDEPKHHAWPVFQILRFLVLTVPVPIPDEEKKLTWIFIFVLLCGTSKDFMKALKAFLKSFQAPQRSENKNLSWFLFYYNFLKCTGREGLRWLRDLFFNRLWYFFNDFHSQPWLTLLCKTISFSEDKPFFFNCPTLQISKINPYLDWTGRKFLMDKSILRKRTIVCAK